jgi:hypothetical protein
MADQGLKILRYLNELAPAGVVLRQDAQVSASVPGVVLPQGALPGQLGLYVWNGSRWSWSGASADGQTVTGRLRNLGPLALGLDQTPPALAALSVSDGQQLESARPVITGQVTDAGAGVGREGITVLLDDEATPFDFKEESGEVSFQPAKALRPGSHTLALVVKDRAGNTTTAAKMSLTAPEPFGLRECIAYPSPARLFTRIRHRLTQPAYTARISVDLFDVTGKRLRRLVAEGPFTAAAQDLEWDLLTDDGTGVGNGVYLFRSSIVSTSGQAVKSKGKLAVQR